MLEANGESSAVRVTAGDVLLDGELVVPPRAHAVVLFAHGSGSSRASPRNVFVARALQHQGLATLLIDLLTPDESEVDARTAELRFDIHLLAERLVCATDWALRDVATRLLPVAYFGASTGAAAALVAAAARIDEVRAVVSRGGRPDLAGAALTRVRAPTLFLVGSRDGAVLDLTRKAIARMRAPARISVVPNAGHLFEEPGALAEVAAQAGPFLRAACATPGLEARI